MNTLNLLSLGDELLAAVLSTRWSTVDEDGHQQQQGLDAQDLLRLSRTCSTCLKVVRQDCGRLWQQLFREASFTAYSRGRQQPAPEPSVDAALQCYKERWTDRRNAERLQRRVQLMQLRSAVQVAQQRLVSCRAELRHERLRHKRISSEEREIRRQQIVASASASQAWVPSAVRQSWDVVKSASPEQATWRLTQLEQEQLTCVARIGQLEQSIKAQTHSARALEHKLRAAEGG